MSVDQHQQAGQTERGKFAVITLSDTRTADTDISGRTIQKLLTEAGHAVSIYKVLADYPTEPLEHLLEWCCNSNDVHAIITNGGTGVYKRDLAVPIIQKYIDTPLPGFGELFRQLSYEQIGPAAMISRAAGGIARYRPIFALPGSTKAVELAMTRIILPTIGHLFAELRKK